jgi:hypothetical protein
VRGLEVGSVQREHTQNAYQHPSVLYQVEILSWLILALTSRLPVRRPVRHTLHSPAAIAKCNGAVCVTACGVARVVYTGIPNHRGGRSALVGSASPPCYPPEYKHEKLMY